MRYDRPRPGGVILMASGLASMVSSFESSSSVGMDDCSSLVTHITAVLRPVRVLGEM